MNSKVFLIGFMGSGKSAAGKMLAERLGCDFVDTDHLITEKTGMDIPAIFSSQGEIAFRECENDTIYDIVKKPGRLVIATGGGMPCSEENIKLMNFFGKTVYLKRSPDELYELLETETLQRPLISQATDLRTTIIQMLTHRSPFYEMASHVVEIQRHESLQAVVDRIEKVLDMAKLP